MNPDLSVYESHAITEQIEEILSERFSVYDTDVHVEPAAIPEDEIYGNVLRKLIRNEKIILSKIPGYENTRFLFDWWKRPSSEPGRRHC